jgi:hypothetical protein
LRKNLPLRRDVVALLTYLRDNKVTGTQSTGNLAVESGARDLRPVCRSAKTGRSHWEAIFRVRSETEVWPLHFRHVLASVGGLVTGGMGRRWKLTPLGERFLAAPAPLQVWLLWRPGGRKPIGRLLLRMISRMAICRPDFQGLRSNICWNYRLGEPASFERFADRMIEDSRMVWPIQDQDNARRILRSIIERTVINPLVDFGILQTEYEPHKTLGAEFRELATFRITPFGKGLLEAINGAMKQDQP